MPTNQGISAFNFDFHPQCPPKDSIPDSRFPIPDYNWVLVGIAYLIVRRSIMILISNAHPTIFGIGGHCLFNCSPFNHDFNQQCPPYDVYINKPKLP
ncbi:MULTISPECIES: hypothetical protein [Moorena]|uniref:Uncharacterized protein n=1 Tax=Moorena producens (strain JHB) TaxID=1454205 RepID=A0A1D9G4G2_MOOP1|nr:MULTISPECIES: hypothetical protein [Moorena]AOY82532.2 hypothetical protein BJP36_24070 [Moorena producens JHB]NEP35351.1 hypothetical protein [Moorena sp. SIO3B2]NEQ10942.1 hypothetical protein [Moorena sp. SIO4E2]NET63590.1 hypothetical protein [Moorena sp. SIO1G6]